MANKEEAELVRRGAECVTGDLILHRKVVGQYRMGQFLLTQEGRDELDNVVEVLATEPKARPGRKGKGKGKDEAPAGEPSLDDLDLGDLGDLGGLDAE